MPQHIWHNSEALYIQDLDERGLIVASRRIELREPISVVATVNRYDHNRSLRSIRIESGPPHVMAHIGTYGAEMYGEAASETLIYLSEKGYSYSVRTEFVEVGLWIEPHVRERAMGEA